LPHQISECTNARVIQADASIAQMTVIQLKQEDINNTAWAMPVYLAWPDEDELVNRRGTSTFQGSISQKTAPSPQFNFDRL